MATKLRYASIEKTSIKNEDLMSKELNIFDPAYTRPKIRKMSMKVDKDCHLVINGDRIKVLANLGLEWQLEDTPIHSLVMETQDVAIYAILAY